MEDSNKKHLLKRDDPRLAYTLDEIFDAINRCEEDAMQEFIDDGRESGVLQMWVPLNTRLVTDDQIDQIMAEYANNNWSRFEVERHDEDGRKSLYICLYI